MIENGYARLSPSNAHHPDGGTVSPVCPKEGIHASHHKHRGRRGGGCGFSWRPRGLLEQLRQKDDGKASVYYLNFKPEAEKAWKKVAAEYKKKTGVEVKIRTAAAGNYEQTLKTEINKSDAPTLFNVNGPIGLKNWEKYASDLSDEKFTKDLTKKDLALKGEDGKIYGVPFTTEGYGIVYNDAIMKKYFALPDAKAKSVDEIKGFDKLKEVAEDMQAKKDQLGIKGAFASTSLASGEDWRWHTHLANYPLHYELKDAKAKDADTLKGTYLDNYKKIFDLYLKNSTVSPSEASNKSVSDSMSEFAHGQAAMVQNGNWAWEQIKGDKGNVVKPEDVHFLPIYTGVKGEEKNGIAIGTENYLALNNKASESDKKASIDFVNWLYTSKEGAKLVSEDLGFIAPLRHSPPRARPIRSVRKWSSTSTTRTWIP